MSEECLYDKDTGSAYGTYSSYIKGFFLSIIITTTAFVIVGFNLLQPLGLIIAVVFLAILQLFVQLIYFLHLSINSKAQWNLVSAVFAVIVVFIIIAGSMWIMFDLYDMMM